ncbi:MAG: hypothetical protein QM718_03300 [Steroidobacteraceae bacterium]
MRPLSVLLGIVMGSAIAVAVSLSMTGIVFLLLPEYADRLASEVPSLVKGIVGAWVLTALAATAFRAELREWPWRRYPQFGLLLSLAALAAWYWPRT